MSQINVNNLTFCYEESIENVFENVTFSIDTNWKLGLIGRNGKGKTTFLRLLLGTYSYKGSIHANVTFDFFPYKLNSSDKEKCAIDFIEDLKRGIEQWRVICELDKLGLDAQVLYRSFNTLSFGEQTKVLLAVLFSGENEFLLIDEPTNHLDLESKIKVKEYLAQKKGFILVSHDRDLLDGCVDHILALNRNSIEVQAGNFTSWWENKIRKDHFELAENEKHKKEIHKLKEAAKRTKGWADKNESTKIGFDPVKEHDRSIATRAYIGAKTKKMQSRVKQTEKRIEQTIQEKEGLMKDVEECVDLKLIPLQAVKKTLVVANNYGLGYKDVNSLLFDNLSFELKAGERIFLNGENGCGKSSLIREILKRIETDDRKNDCLVIERGSLVTASNLKVSYVNQDTSFLHGDTREFCKEQHLDEGLFYSILRQLGMERSQFRMNLENYSEGQKKKVLIAASLLTPAHIYMWDEPLNYIDIFSRMQIEQLLKSYQPTMLVVDHDVRFREEIATKVIDLK